MTARQGSTAAPRVPDTQGHFCLDVVPDGARGELGKALGLAGPDGSGVLSVPGAYECRVMVDGWNIFEAFVRASAVTGSFAPRLETRYLDNTQRAQAAGVNLVATTQQALTLTDLRGQRYVFLCFTIPSGGSVTFDRAEFNGL